MSVYLITDVKVIEDFWIPDYVANVHDIFYRHGGKYRSRSASIINIEGEPLDTTLIAVLEFPDLQSC